MIFNSVTYVLFLVLTVCLYWALPRRARLWMLFLASLTFYGFWRVEYLAAMLFSATLDYTVSRRLGKTDDERKRRLLLGASLVGNLGLLFYFKYLVFFLDNVWFGLSLLGVKSTPPALDILLPLGISFYTFQTISYTIDVYRRQLEPLEDFALYGTYVTFFPQLVAGPVLRCGEVTPQLDERPAFRIDDVVTGIQRVLCGLFLKVVLADNLAVYVDAGFSQDVTTLSALDVLTLAFLFGYQIYFDFSAYSHVALGSARMMGIQFPENFNFPYAARSPKDFWGRWHISLSSWIRDYLYIPLTGARFVISQSKGGLEGVVTDRPLHPNRALFLTWAIMGLWHGANWTFVFWGLYHAICIFIYRKTKGGRESLRDVVRTWGGWAITFPVMMLSWIPFRARDLSHTFSLYAKLGQPREYLRLGMRENVYLVAALITAVTMFAYVIHRDVMPKLRAKPTLWYPAEAVTMAVVIGLVFVFLRPIQQFIYFQF